MNTEADTPRTTSAPTINAVVRDTPAPITDAKVFRRYIGHLRIRGKTDEWNIGSKKKVIYRVGARKLTAKDIFRRPDPEWASVPQVFPLNQEMHAAASAKVARTSLYRANLGFCDLSGVLHTLGRAAAFYTLNGGLSCDLIRNGAPVNVSSVALATQAVPSSGTVFVPRLADPYTGEFVFAVIAAAVNHCGVEVVTDILHVDDENRPKYAEPTGSECFEAVWVAARGLLQQYHVSGRGAMGIWAFVSGLHSTLTVAGHTDEGGFLRDAARRYVFAPPFGAACVENWEDFTGLASLRKANLAAVQSQVDGVVLLSAAAAALADPMVTVDGEQFPTVFTAGVSVADEGAPTAEERQAMVDVHVSTIKAQGLQFCENWVTEVAKLFGLSGGEAEAAQALNTGIDEMKGHVCRHLEHPVVAPFYWVEPTSIYPTRDRDNAVNAAGYGVLAGHQVAEHKAFHEDQDFVNADTLHEYSTVKWRSARTDGLSLFTANTEPEMQARYQPRQFDPDLIVNKGGDLEPADAAMARCGLGEYLWRHGSCQIPSPAEMLYTGGHIGMKTVKMMVDTEGDAVAEVHTVNATNTHGQDSGLTLQAGKPRATTSGTASNVPREIRRQLSQAARIIAAGGDRGLGLRRVSLGQTDMPIKLTVVRRKSSRAPAPLPTPPSAVLQAPAPALRRVQEARPGPASRRHPTARATATPLRFARVERAEAGAPTTAAAPPPAPAHATDLPDLSPTAANALMAVTREHGLTVDVDDLLSQPQAMSAMTNALREAEPGTPAIDTIRQNFSVDEARRIVSFPFAEPAVPTPEGAENGQAAQ